jgi:ATP-dependent RNA helicase DHX57
MSAFQALKILTKTYYDLNLPIVEHLTDFNRIFKDNQLIVVKTGTGSGKSTVLPPYLVGLGMRKVMVTQPRRLPCSEIYKRVDSIYGGDMVGYMFAGESKNPAGKLIYITDGLLKEKIYANEDDLAKIDVIMLDEIHERSKSVDLILLLLIRALNKHKHLKVILCSATVNDQIMNMFDNTIKRATFEVAIPGFQVTEHPIDEGKPILDEVNELSGKLIMGTQMLVFFSSIKEVEDSTKLFK